jgi:hypothetical protein
MKPKIYDIVGQTIRVSNDLSLYAPKTFLASPGTAGSSVISWDNGAGLSASWALQIGETGDEKTEIKLLGTSIPAATLGTLTANLDFDHPADTPIYGIKYDKAVFGSAVGTTGTAVEIASGTITYKGDSQYTIFDHTAGSSQLSYQVYYLNSITTGSSVMSDWASWAGYPFYSLAAIRNRGMSKLWNADFVTKEVGNDWVNECKDTMAREAIQTNEDYAFGTENVAFGTDGYGTITTADFSNLRKVWITYNGVDKFQSTKMNANDFLPTQYFSSAHPYHNFRGDNVIQVHPGGPGTAELEFYRFGTTLVNETDLLPVPMRPYTDIFTEYFKAQALFKDEKFTEAENTMARVNRMVANFVANLGARDKTGPTMIDIVEMVSGDDRVIN